MTATKSSSSFSLSYRKSLAIINQNNDCAGKKPKYRTERTEYGHFINRKTPAKLTDKAQTCKKL